MEGHLQRLIDARERPSEFRSVWQSLLSRLERPWDGSALGAEPTGHIPHQEMVRLLDDRSSLVDRPGVYVWGAWRGVDARVQYIGIAHNRPIWKRFGRYRNEWMRAERHAALLRSLPENFSPNRESKSEREMRYSAIAGAKNWSHRLQRAERYAKIGLSNLWYCPLPAPDLRGSSLTDVLKDVEAQLIQLSNALLFEHFQEKRARAFPVLNKTHFGPGSRRRVNHHYPTDATAYREWMDGPAWWSQWDRECGLI